MSLLVNLKSPLIHDQIHRFSWSKPRILTWSSVLNFLCCRMLRVLLERGFLKSLGLVGCGWFYPGRNDVNYAFWWGKPRFFMGKTIVWWGNSTSSNWLPIYRNCDHWISLAPNRSQSWTINTDTGWLMGNTWFFHGTSMAFQHNGSKRHLGLSEK